MDAVSELLQRFTNPDKAYGPVPIWWWSGAPLRNDRLRWQMEQLTSQGVHAAVIMCLAPRGPIFGSVADDPPFLSEPWWEIFLTACADADEVGFQFWLYDQLGFSGANFQGQLVSAQPDWSGHELRRSGTSCAPGRATRVSCPAGATPVGAYFVPATASPGHVPLSVPVVDGAAEWSGGAGRLVLAYSVRQGFDYFSADAGEALVDRVLGEFERRAQKWFGSVIVGLFQDELPNMPTWGADFLETFHAAYGYDLDACIGLLWEDGDLPGSRVRRDYHAHRATLARRGFFEPLGAWTVRTGVTAGFDQQSPAREGDPVGSVTLYGDYLRTHDMFGAPGSDHWGDPKVHSSLAHAKGHPRVWLEAFHSSGWGGTLEETYDWLAPFLRRGATLYDPHAVYYATVSGWWEWAPPSTCWRQPYWPSYKTFSLAVTRLCSLLTVGELVADTILLTPTTTSQARNTLAGPLPDAEHASDVFHELNGVSAWFSEAPGVLDRAGLDYEVFDDATVAAAELRDGRLHVGAGSFRNVVLPATAVIASDLAGRLADLAAAGGRVVCVEFAPVKLVGDDDAAMRRWHEAIASGDIIVAGKADDVPDAIGREALVHADAPVLVRRHGDALVLVLNAHDERTGTQAPIIPGHRNLKWVEESFRWDRYWTTLGEKGYDFVPVGDRVATVSVATDKPLKAQLWDARSGTTSDIEVTRDDSGLHLRVPFSNGAMSVVVLADALPVATHIEPGAALDEQAVEGPWTVLAESTLDNRWADVGDARDTGIVPLELWRFDHATGPTAPDAGWSEVLATFGPYVSVRGPEPTDAAAGRGADGTWERGEFSLSRGIRKDALHYEYLGPKGMVPEEFLAWPTAGPGDWVAFRTQLEISYDAEQQLIIGANARRRVFLGGQEVPVHEAGYWTSHPLAAGGGTVELEVWLEGDESLSPDPKDGPTLGIRASFAVVVDPPAHARPEWLVPDDATRAGSAVTFRRQFANDGVHDAVVQVGTEGPAVVLVNGVEAGRQGAFEPYANIRQMRIHSYDVGALLQDGDNELAVVITDPGRQVALFVDSRPATDGGLGIVSDTSWAATRDDAPIGVALRQEQWTDPRWACLYARPHPLPRAAWLDPATDGTGVVLDVVPNAFGAEPRREWLRCTAPIGATAVTLDANAPATVLIEGAEYAADVDGTVTFPHPMRAGDEILMRFDTSSGHSGGGLLRGPLRVQLAEQQAPLGDWQELGLRSLAGNVTYRTTFVVEPVDDDVFVLDLGAVRGAADVTVNGGALQSAVWSPYRLDVTSDVMPGTNELVVVVRGTLAGYLDDVSPTPAIAAGQTVTGLFGPVRLVRMRRT